MMQKEKEQARLTESQRISTKAKKDRESDSK
jgi:hypothetical protein